MTSGKNNQHVAPQTDIEISQAAHLKPIVEIARERLGIPLEYISPYGHYKGKIALDYIASLKDKPDGKLILVTAINPTPAGEGKTTTTIGLSDALNYIGKKALVCIREPSLGPCFGQKGGATGGDTRRSRRWKTSICISPAIFMPSARPIICSRP